MAKTIGRKFTTLEVQHTEHIRRPLSEVFAYVSDLTHETQWQPDIRSVTITSPPPFGVGSTFTEVRRTFGRTYVWEMRVTAFERDRVIGIASVGGATPYAGTRTFEAAQSVEGGAVTAVTEHGTVGLAVWLWPMKAVLARLSRRALAVAYGRLARILEG